MKGMDDCCFYPLGASLASMALSSPIAVRTITSERISHIILVLRGGSLTGILLFLAEELVDLVANFTLRNFHIIFSIAGLGHEGEKAIIGNVELCIL